eukprot:TRINITY_DN755_c0_g2_i1.p1 TRINITY_DN755_c0_g2~~TRINITY_DN755_c0_g2_i1.p1  ORF type:complete len:993 (+),score=242.74 TRINITY_DN755_c0_g2_i1:68-3046(+)
MEVRLDAAAGQISPKDTFVSMRVGDVQKQSRLSASRTYKFPDPGDNRAGFGRIEVFQRIGHLTISFDNLAGKGQDVEVPCDYPGLDKLRLRLAVTGGSMQEIPVAKKAKVKSKLDAAQKYLADHRLEELLADAMREVIHQKPTDPHVFLSTQIMKHARSLPPPPPAAKEAGEESFAGKPAKVAAHGGAAVEELRKQAADALVNAARDGSLHRALAGVKDSSNDVQAIRMQAREALMRSAKEGTLEAALTGAKKASSADVDELRTQARNALLRSAQDGSLEAALSQAKAPAMDVDALRIQARQVLLRSAQDGTLEAALCEAKVSTTDIEALRGQARQALLSSAKNGNLEAALAEAKGSRAKMDVDTLRLQARQALLRSAQDGSLDAALSEAKGSVTMDVDTLRMQARQALIRSARDGTLEAALDEAKADAMDVDTLRAQARDALLTSARDGTLGEVLGKNMAGGALLRSARDGSLKAMLGGQPIDMPFRDYYATNIRPLPTSDLQNLYSKFPSKPKPAVKASSSRLQALCSQVKDALLRAARDGTLQASLQVSDVDALRLQAKDALQRSAKDGSLNAILREEQGLSMDICALRSQANQALLRSAKDGSLQRALAEEQGSFTDIAALRSQVHGALLHSAKDGTLQATLTSNPEVSGLCCQVKDALLRSAKDGSLNASVRQAQASSSDLERLRLEARNTLILSAKNGSLQAALDEAKAWEGSSSTGIEALRVEARDTLLRAAQSGALEIALSRSLPGEKTINPMTIMSFDDMDLNHDGKIDKDEWERAVAIANAQATGAFSAEENKVIRSLQDTISQKDAEIAALKELLRSTGQAPPAATMTGSPVGARPAKSAPFRDYYTANFCQLHTSDLQNLYSKFPAKPKPKTCVITSQKAALNTTPFALLPSVGTWLAQPSKPKVEQASPPILFNQKPSVATWFAFRPKGLDRPRTVNIAAVSQEKLVTMKAEDLVYNFQKEINRRDEEIKRLKQMLNVS